MIKLSRILLNNFKFLANRERIIYKNRREAIGDFAKTSGASLLAQIGMALIILEFGFPTPDIVYDIKRLISPDFKLFCETGDLVDMQMDFENRYRTIRKEEINSAQKALNVKSPEAKFGGIM